MTVRAENILQGPDTEHACLVGLMLRACQIAKSAARDAAEVVGTNLPELYGAVEHCEKELDRLDRDLDQRLYGSLENTSALQRREMLACVKCMTDLERIGDLVLSFVSGNRALRTRLENDDVYELMRMALLLEKMLNDVYDALVSRNLNRALTALVTDAEIDRLRKLLFIRHIQGTGVSFRSGASTCCSWRRLWRAPVTMPRIWLRKCAAS